MGFLKVFGTVRSALKTPKIRHFKPIWGGTQGNGIWHLVWLIIVVIFVSGTFGGFLWAKYKRKAQRDFDFYTTDNQVLQEEFYVSPESGMKSAMKPAAEQTTKPTTEPAEDFSRAVWAHNLSENRNEATYDNSDEAVIAGETAITGDTVIADETEVTGDTVITDETAITGDTVIADETAITDDIVIADEALVDTDLSDTEEFAEKENDLNIEITENRFYIEVPCICQKPELPTGCETVAAVAGLNYLGIEINKTDFASNYLECGTPGTDSPFDKFLGNPFKTKKSYGCYAPVIIKAIKKLLEEKQLEDIYTVTDLSGNSVDCITENYVKNGIPVIIWATMDMKKSVPGTKWKTEKYGTIIWQKNEHCMVLIGRDTDKNTVIVMDPLTGKYEDYDFDTFCLRYEEQYSQAVAVTY